MRAVRAERERVDVSRVARERLAHGGGGTGPRRSTAGRCGRRGPWPGCGRRPSASVSGPAYRVRSATGGPLGLWAWPGPVTSHSCSAPPPTRHRERLAVRGEHQGPYVSLRRAGRGRFSDTGRGGATSQSRTPAVAGGRRQYLSVRAEGSDTADHVRRRQRPQTDLAVTACRWRGWVPVGAEAEGVHPHRCRRRGARRPARVGRVADVPQARRAVRAARGEHGAVGAERHRPDGSAVTGERCADRLRPGGVGDVPQPYGVVRAAAGEGAAVGAEGHGVHQAAVAGQCARSARGGAGRPRPRAGPSRRRRAGARACPSGLKATERTPRRGGAGLSVSSASVGRPADVPQADGAVVVGGGQGVAVRPKASR